MNKKFLIAIIFVLFLVSGGVFWWWQTWETPLEKWEKAEYSKPEDYVVKETPEGKIIENKKAGLSFRIPEGWRVEKPPQGISDFIRIFSPGAEEKNAAIMESGCRIIPEVHYVKADIGVIEEEVSKGIWNPYIVTSEIIEISRHGTFKYVAESQEFGFYRIGIAIPIQSNIPLIKSDKLCSFALDTTLQDKEECIRVFEKFLDTVSIK